MSKLPHIPRGWWWAMGGAEKALFVICVLGFLVALGDLVFIMVLLATGRI